jgi:CRP-like cAMP-binding protein
MSVPANRRSVSNRILSALSDEDYLRITAEAQQVSLMLTAPLYEPHEPIPSIYFLNAGICSVITTMADGTSIEVMIVGREGIIGLPALESESATTSTRAFMQVAGSALKINAAVIRQEFSRPGKLQSLLLRQMQFTVAQISQTAACNRLHNLEERLSRWLLMVQDSLQADTFLLTHEFIAQMLGTRRSSVTLAAGMLQRAGLIEYRRGEIHIANRKGLESAACECYPIVKTSFDRFLEN